ncbi:hypothetical protein HBB16_01740 [Pseudonocardia sp. MCCB 268]|nr:hypothetical protein [Pseudonocardia cytotoxica]
MIGWDLIWVRSARPRSPRAGAGTSTASWADWELRCQEFISGSPTATAGAVDPPAVFVALAMMVVLIIGIKLSAWVNATITTQTADRRRHHPHRRLLPRVQRELDAVHPTVAVNRLLRGRRRAAAALPDLRHRHRLRPDRRVHRTRRSCSFAYLGFDIVATLSEVKNPQRTMPIGIIASLAIATVLYIIDVADLHRDPAVRPAQRGGARGAPMAATGVPAAGSSSRSASQSNHRRDP